MVTRFDSAPILHANVLRIWCKRFWADTFVRGAQMIRLNYARKKMTIVAAQRFDGVWRATCMDNNGRPVQGVGLGLTESESVVALAAAHYNDLVSPKTPPALPDGLPNQVTGWNAADELWMAEAVEPPGMVPTQYREDFLAHLESAGDITP
jgi:hypothetical protein